MIFIMAVGASYKNKESRTGYRFGSETWSMTMVKSCNRFRSGGRRIRIRGCDVNFRIHTTLINNCNPVDLPLLLPDITYPDALAYYEGF